MFIAIALVALFSFLIAGCSSPTTSGSNSGSQTGTSATDDHAGDTESDDTEASVNEVLKQLIDVKPPLPSSLQHSDTLTSNLPNQRVDFRPTSEDASILVEKSDLEPVLSYGAILAEEYTSLREPYGSVVRHLRNLAEQDKLAEGQIISAGILTDSTLSGLDLGSLVINRSERGFKVYWYVEVPSGEFVVPSYMLWDVAKVGSEWDIEILTEAKLLGRDHFYWASANTSTNTYALVEDGYNYWTNLDGSLDVYKVVRVSHSTVSDAGVVRAIVRDSYSPQSGASTIETLVWGNADGAGVGTFQITNSRSDVRLSVHTSNESGELLSYVNGYSLTGANSVEMLCSMHASVSEGCSGATAKADLVDNLGWLDVSTYCSFSYENYQVPQGGPPPSFYFVSTQTTKGIVCGDDWNDGDLSADSLQAVDASLPTKAFYLADEASSTPGDGIFSRIPELGSSSDILIDGQTVSASIEVYEMSSIVHPDWLVFDQSFQAIAEYPLRAVIPLTNGRSIYRNDCASNDVFDDCETQYVAHSSSPEDQDERLRLVEAKAYGWSGSLFEVPFVVTSLRNPPAPLQPSNLNSILEELEELYPELDEDYISVETYQDRLTKISDLPEFIPIVEHVQNSSE